MTTTGSSALRRFAFDASEEEQTHLYVRPRPMPWERAMVKQIMRDLEVPAPPVRRTPPPSARVLTRSPSPAAVVRRPKNVFLTPPSPMDAPAPWATPAGATSRAASGARRVAAKHGGTVVVRARRRSMIPWLVFAMSFGIAFGVVQDHALRAELHSEALATADHVLGVAVAKLESLRP